MQKGRPQSGNLGAVTMSEANILIAEDEALAAMDLAETVK